MSKEEIEILRLMRRLWNTHPNGSFYYFGMLDGVKAVLDILGYKYPPDDYLDLDSAKIERR